ncbi:MAG: hypothetical protein WBN79_10990, partial [Gemmatimonadota bacterium]
EYASPDRVSDLGRNFRMCGNPSFPNIKPADIRLGATRVAREIRLPGARHDSHAEYGGDKALSELSHDSLLEEAGACVGDLPTPSAGEK